LNGYLVLEASDGEDALHLASGFNGPIHLMISDVVMPRIGGAKLAEQLRSFRPDLKVLFVSGYAGQTVVDHKVVDVENNFLQKPFTLKQLANKIRAVLDHRGNADPTATDAVERHCAARVGSE
jgi:hypothetical protein